MCSYAFELLGVSPHISNFLAPVGGLTVGGGYGYYRRLIACMGNMICGFALGE